MTPITSTEDQIPLRLSIRTEFALHDHETMGQVLYEVKNKQARQLAEKILSIPKFFELKADSAYGAMRADVICLTQEDYTNILRERFKAGVDHARGFMPEWRN